MQPCVGERGQRAQRGCDVRRLRVVDVADAAELADELEAVRDARERAQRLGDRRVVDPRGTGRGGRRGGVLAVVRARDARLGGQRVVARRTRRDALRRERPKPRGTTAVSSAPAARRCGASRRAYASKVPWRSRWSGSRLRSTATRGRSVSTSSSWNDESSHTTHASGEAAPTSDVSGRPTLPATSTGRPAGAEDRAEQLGRRRLAVRAGDAEDRVREEPRAELDLAPHGDAARARAATSSVSPGTPGLFTTRSIPCSSVSSSRPR